MTDLATRLKELREKATPGPWQLCCYQSGTVSVLMRRWPAPNEYGQGYLAATMTAFNIGSQDENEIGREKFYNAELIALLFNNLDTIIAALSRHREEDGWQPIETAPKDAISILGFQATPGDHENRMAVCWRCGKSEAAPLWVGEGGLMPTHWMPLPASPLATSTESGK